MASQDFAATIDLIVSSLLDLDNMALEPLVRAAVVLCLSLLHAKSDAHRYLSWSAFVAVGVLNAAMFAYGTQQYRL